VLFQTLDDKKSCVGIYHDGNLIYNDIPSGLSKTWSYSGFLEGSEIEYANLYVQGRGLDEVCPPELEEEWRERKARMKAFLRCFNTAKINLKDICLFEVIPEAFLLEWCEIKNKICTYIFENYEKPSNYEFLLQLTQVIEKIKYQELNIDPTELHSKLGSYRSRAFLKKIKTLEPFIDYNVFGTVTGRLTTKSYSFPILTLDKRHRNVLKPNNDWFVEFDYNAAELRTFLALQDIEQPQEDLHEWNVKNIFGDSSTREDAKTRLFAWLYNPNSDDYLLNRTYDREKLIKENWKGGKITTKFDRTIEVDERRALNYLIQSTSSDLFLRQMIKVDELLEDSRSYVAFTLHDSLTIDLAEEDKGKIPEIVKIFGSTPFGEYVVNVSAGKDYGSMRKIQ
jgi:hypothetical protein